MKFPFFPKRREPASTPPAAPKKPRSPNYRNPPADTRFRKGRSGNPKGRPPRVAPATEILTRLPSDSLQDMLHAEAFRMVRVQVGDRTVEIPVIQAALREIGLSAAKGDRLALAAMTQLVLRTMPDRLAPPDPEAPDALAVPALPEPAPDTALAAADEYKRVWTAVLREAATLEDADPPAPVPHPDDVAVAHIRGEASWPGSTPDALLSLDDLAAHHARLTAELPPLREKIERRPTGYDRAVDLCRWFAQDDLRRLIARHLPDRYGTRAQAEYPDRPTAVREASVRRVARSDREYYAPERVAEREQREAAERERQSQGMDGPAVPEGALVKAPPPIDPKEAAQKVQDAAYRAWVYRQIEEQAAGGSPGDWYAWRYGDEE